jgi:hypothetical protein
MKNEMNHFPNLSREIFGGRFSRDKTGFSRDRSKNQIIHSFHFFESKKMNQMNESKNPPVWVNLSRENGVCHAKVTRKKTSRDRVWPIKTLDKRHSVTLSREEGSLARVLSSKERKEIYIDIEMGVLRDV